MPLISYMVAGAIGFTWTWNPQVGQSGPNSTNINTLTGLNVLMTVQNTTAGTAPVTFIMTVSEDGTTASYTTQSTNDFPAPGQYTFQFSAYNTNGTLAIPAFSVQQYISPRI